MPASLHGSSSQSIRPAPDDNQACCCSFYFVALTIAVSGEACTKNRQRRSERQSSEHRNPRCGLFLPLAFALFYLSAVRLHIPRKYLWPLLLLASGCAAERSRSVWVMDHGGLAGEKDQAGARTSRAQPD